MADEKKIRKAIEVYNSLCDVIKGIGWKHNCNYEGLTIDFEVTGEDLPISFIIIVDIERQMIRFFSPLPFKVSEEKAIEFAVAVCAASNGLVDGNFVYDLEKQSVMFKLTAVFMDSDIGEGLLRYMIQCAGSTVDQYNDKFLALNKGFIGIDAFINE